MLSIYRVIHRRIAFGFVIAALIMSFSFGVQADTSFSEDCVNAHRSFHIIPNRIPIEDLLKIMVTAKNADFCTMVLGIRSGISLNAIEISSKIEVMDREYLTKVAELAENIGLEVVPELKLLTHQEHFLKQKFPDQMINLTTYDPNSNVIRDLVEHILLEVIDILNAKAVHIGHDELTGITRYSRKHFMNPGEKIATSDQYLASVVHLHEFLRKQNVETWMWGDMLIEAHEAPGMITKNFHGHLEGFGRTLRKKIPKDIVIFDWHYKDNVKDYHSIGVLKKDGFDVVGVTYNVNIQNHVASARKQGALGMMLTNWDMAIEPDLEKMQRRLKVIGADFR